MGFLDVSWHQRGLDALKETLDVDARGKQQMIEFLFDEGFWDRETLSHKAALARFNAALNPAQPGFFKTSELWALMKRFQRFALLQAMVEDMGFALMPLPTEARRQDLMLRLAEALERNTTAMDAARAELERIDATPPPRPATPGIHGAGPKFDMRSPDLHEDDREKGGF